MMVNERQSIEVDVLARPPWEFKSNRLEAMWWRPERTAEIHYAIQNTAEVRVSGKLTLTDSDGHAIKSVALDMAPHQTRVYKLHELLDEAMFSQKVGGISIEHAGRPGDLRAQSFILRRSIGFSASLQFEDPKAVVDSRLEGAGVLVGSEEGVSHAALFSGHLLLRNVSAEAVTVKAQVQRAANPDPLADVHLEAGEAKEVLVPADSAYSVGKEPRAAGVAIEYTGKPGSVLAYWFSVDSSGSLVVETPLRSPATLPQAGSNPWSLEGDYSSVLYVKNTATKPSSFVADIFYRGGYYMIGMKTLEAGETAAIDIRRLRDEQIPDVNGHKLPTRLTSGQINWRTRNGEPRLIGRVNTMSVSKGLANNMSCSVCCACPSSQSVSLAPSSWTGDVGSTFSFSPTESDWSNCGTQTYPLSASSLAPWTSDNASVAVNQSTGVISCQAVGSATVSGDIFLTSTDIDYKNIPIEACPNCISTSTEQNPGAPVTVGPKITGPNTVWWFNGQSPSGYATQITLTSTGGAGTMWKVTAGSNQVTLSSNSGSQITVTATGNPVSSTTGDVTITATANSQPSPPFALTTRRPFRLVAGTITAQCDATFGYSDLLSYTIQDNLMTNMPSAVPLNENWTTSTIPDMPNNWLRPDPGSSTTDDLTPALFADHITGPAVAVANPTPVCVAAGQAVQHWGQEWKIGSTTVGSGTRVQTDILTRFTQHAEHDSIVTGSGVQP